MTRILRERPIDFTSDDIVATCKHCGARIPMSHEQFDNHVHIVDCPECERPLTHDDRVLASTAAEADPRTSVREVPAVAWYHTSIHQEWPPAAAAARDRAIHVGPYEAAIDNMHRRMRNEAEADKLFYLHRVTLDPSASIDPELHEDVAGFMTGFVPLTTVTAQGHTVRRYINGVEHRGQVSLAITLEAIESVQTLPVPVASLAPPATQDAHLAHARCIRDMAAARRSYTSRVEAELPDPDPTRRRIDERLNWGRYQGDLRAARMRFYEALAAEYLARGVSLARWEALAEALGAREPFDSMDDLRRFREHASLLTQPHAVIAMVTAAPSYRAPVLPAR